jgi:cytochrome c-type biogenesis protein CcmF
MATFRLYINPLINWLWIGCGVLTLGTIIAVWPPREK